MNLLFITHANLEQRPYGDGSTRYRCFNVAEVAMQAGHRVQVRPLHKVSIKDLAQFDLISWLRPVASKKLFKILDRARALNITCVADLDDLIIDSTIAAQSPAVINQFSTEEIVAKRFTNHAQAVRQFDAITVSTNFLEDQVSRLYPQIPIATVRNGLSEYWLQHVEQVHTASHTAGKVGYLPGTRSHDKDFLSIQKPLHKWLNTQSLARLNIVGKLEWKNSGLPAGQVAASPWVDYFKLPYFINQQEALLAPLPSSQFNNAKSHVKFIEAAALGVPLISSSNPDIVRHNIGGLLLADSGAQWYESLSAIMETDFRSEHAPGLREYARTHCSATCYCEALMRAWESGYGVPDTFSENTLAAAA